MSRQDLYDWIHDDITWCADNDCPLMNCMRNPKNMANPVGYHSYALFRNTEECPIYLMEQNAEAERNDTQ